MLKCSVAQGRGSIKVLPQILTRESLKTLSLVADQGDNLNSCVNHKLTNDVFRVAITGYGNKVNIVFSFIHKCLRGVVV